jgi:hypothetical protein
MYQLYHPEKDPLVQRARKRNRHTSPILIAIIVALVGWVAYREVIQPRLNNSSASVDTAPRLTKDSAPPASPATALVNAENRQLYTIGQSAMFGMSADLSGKGSPALEGTTGLHLRFATDFTFSVVNLLEDGSVTLEAQFGDANVYGNRFGYPINIARRGGVTQSFAAEAAPAITAMNKNYDGPNLTEFDSPIRVNVAPDGSPSEDAAAGKVARLLGALIKLSGTAFPQTTLQQGSVWERDVVFTLPGMDFPVAAKVTSTLIGGANYYGFPCVQIENKIEPANAESSTLIPSLKAAAALGRIEVSGYGTTYYDPVSKILVFAQSEFDVNLMLAESMESVSQLFGSHAGILAELEGGPAFDMENYLRTAGDVPLGIHVQTTIARKK